mgnify:CR=1 FL=1
MEGKPSMVDISGKKTVFREATAVGVIKLKPETVRRIKEGKVEKGNPLHVASTMATLAVKETPKIIALCHPIPISNVDVDFSFPGEDKVQVKVTVRAEARTGVEMEALTGVAVALLNLWDMVKRYEKDEAGQYPETAILSLKVERKVKLDE